VRQPFASYIFALVRLGGVAVAIVLRGNERATAQPVRPPRPPAVGTPADFGKRLPPLPTADPNAVPVRPVYPPPEPRPALPPAVPVPPSDEWVRFEDPRIGISFEHPANWLVEARVNDSPGVSSLDVTNFTPGIGEFSAEFFKLSIYIRHGSFPSTTSIDAYLRGEAPTRSEVLSEVIVVVDGQPVVEKRLSNVSGRMTSIQFERAGDTYRFDLFGDTQYRDVFDRLRTSVLTRPRSAP
jgi:hypothetical protein